MYLTCLPAAPSLHPRQPPFRTTAHAVSVSIPYVKHCPQVARRHGWRIAWEDTCGVSTTSGGTVRGAPCALPRNGDSSEASRTSDGSPGQADSPASVPSASASAVAPGVAEGTVAAPPPPPLAPWVLVEEVRSGDLWVNARRAFPKVPWGASQLAQVMAWSTALAVVSATTAVQTPQAAVLASTELRSAAVRHLGLELLCCCLAVAVLYMGLRRSKPRAAGHFQYGLDPQVALTVAALAAVLYPLADPVLYDVWSGVEQALSLSGQLPDPGVGLVAQLRGCEAAGDGLSIALHVAASCLVGPLWEETFWRGFFLASMTRVLPLPACVVLSSGAFAALHLGPGTLLPIAALSATCDLLYLRGGTLAAPLAFHAGWNAYQLAGILLAGKDSFV